MPQEKAGRLGAGTRQWCLSSESAGRASGGAAILCMSHMPVAAHEAPSLRQGAEGTPLPATRPSVRPRAGVPGKVVCTDPVSGEKAAGWQPPADQAQSPALPDVPCGCPVSFYSRTCRRSWGSTLSHVSPGCGSQEQGCSESSATRAPGSWDKRATGRRDTVPRRCSTPGVKQSPHLA